MKQWWKDILVLKSYQGWRRALRWGIHDAYCGLRWRAWQR